MLVALVSWSWALTGAGAVDFDILGRVESRGKDSRLAILFEIEPSVKSYYVVSDKTVYGRIEILSVVYNRSGSYRYRAIAVFTPANKAYVRLIRAGDDIALVKRSTKTEKQVQDRFVIEEKRYRKSVFSAPDGRRMVLVPEGKFMFGSDEGDRDESPEQSVFLDNYYIDKYEVSNDDYMKFVRAANAKPPLSWKGRSFKEAERRLPVQVTFHEAEAYARWAGKRLPTEEEWEKAARGTGAVPGTGGGKTLQYPWGGRFDPARANSADFWSAETIGAHIKMRFGIREKGLMPVDAFDPEGASPYGAVNMSGNAREWTCSWYMPYSGNSSRRGWEYRRYGQQYKVVRGGAWYSPRYRLRVTSRETGGKPNLYADNLAGFRCVKDVEVVDLEEK